MPPERRFLSRRAILKTASIAPLAALACRTIADPSDVNLAAVRASMPIPDKEWGDIDVDMRSTHGVGYPKVKYENMVRVLWSFFNAGVNDYSPRVKVSDAILWVAYMYPTATPASGQNVYSHISKFNDHGLDPTTSYCAYDCGQRAAELAYAATKTVTDQNYKDAWDATKAAWLVRLNSLNSRSDVQATSLGYAC